MTNRFCCCSETCTIFLDTFDRSSIGSDYKIENGSWIIYNSALTTSSSDAKIRILKEHPDQNFENERHHILVVTVRIPNAVEGDKHQVRVYYGSSLYVEITITAWQMINSFFVGECSSVKIFENGQLINEKSNLQVFRFSQGAFIFVVGFDETTNVFWVEFPVEQAYNSYKCYQSWDHWLNGSINIEDRDTCNICLNSIKLSAYNTSAFSTTGFSMSPFSQGINENAITKNPFALGTGNIVDSRIDFTGIHYLKGYTRFDEHCPPACFETGGSTQDCLISSYPMAREKNNITDDDFICGGFHIVSGTWDSAPSQDSLGRVSFNFLTSSSDALIEFTSSQVTGIIGAQRLTLISTLPVGCTIRIYLDYVDSSTNHCAYFSRLSLDEFLIQLFKNESLIESQELESSGSSSDSEFTFGVCTVHDIDGSGSDSFGAFIGWLGIAAEATTLNGGARAAFGTGTINTEIKFTASAYDGDEIYGTAFADNSEDCEACRLKECDPCPTGDIPDNGYSISIEGFLNNYPPICFASCVDCPYLDGTYLVSKKYFNPCAGSESYHVCTKNTSLGTYEWLFTVKYNITQQQIYINYGQINLPNLFGTLEYYFIVELKLTGPSSSGSGYTESYYQYAFAVKKMSINCDEIIDELIPVVYISNGYWWICGYNELPCTNLENLEIRVTGY